MTRDTAAAASPDPHRSPTARRVYAYFGPEGLYAYDFNGRLVWKVVEKFPTLGLGTGTSPVLFANLVIIQRDEDTGANSHIVAYDKKTGKEAWLYEAQRRNQLGHAGHRCCGGTTRAGGDRQ